MKNIIVVALTIILALLSIALLTPWPVWLGTLAAWVTTGSFCLQVLHIVKNKETKALSLGMWAALFFGVACWTGYGFRVHDIPVMMANGITALLAITVIGLKLWHERPRLLKRGRRIRRMPGVVLRPRIRSLRPLQRTRDARATKKSKKTQASAELTE
ncbi:hypothetical protein EFZ10_13980 [Tatumella sp. TA1]|uniref:SemiSWEET family sugar transporter n=1 Tax=Rosenbergiella collisarenosi TaxID=1544695 RepID=UPI0012FD26BB|nr:SemiSWEET family transporter [Rosenbergiella collisarenosi]MBT0721440.1 hypothetical protein [Rosenbergiella collisarenosi]QGX92637.1 hypothetical protein EFZ10_13980 [Tatumella sp. TA1]